MGEQREDRQSHFFTWLSRFVSPAQLSELYQAFADLESSLSRSLMGMRDAAAVDALYDDLSANRQFMRAYRSGVKLSLLKHYARYCRENKTDAAGDGQETSPPDSDVLIERLKRDRIAHADYRSKGGTLWIEQTPKTDDLIRYFTAQGVHFSFSEIRQQWGTRDQTMIAPPVQETLDPAVVRHNQNAFVEWLRAQEYDTVEVFSMYGTARKIHALLLDQGSALGLFGIRGWEKLRLYAIAVREKRDFIQGDRQERGLWTKTLDGYLRFAQAGGTAVEKKPSPVARLQTEKWSSPLFD